MHACLTAISVSRVIVTALGFATMARPTIQIQTLLRACYASAQIMCIFDFLNRYALELRVLEEWALCEQSVLVYNFLGSSLTIPKTTEAHLRTRSLIYFLSQLCCEIVSEGSIGLIKQSVHSRSLLMISTLQHLLSASYLISMVCGSICRRKAHFVAVIHDC